MEISKYLKVVLEYSVAGFAPRTIWLQFRATLAVFWGVCAWAGSFLRACMRFCWLEPGVWISSGLWLSSAHAGHGALRPCIHSMLFSFPHLREVHRKCFLKSSHSSKKKSASIYFYTHLDCGLSFDTQHFSIMLHSPKICSVPSSALSRFGTRDKQTSCRWSFI